jgi:WD40 repeat protein
LAYSPDGSRILSGGSDGRIIIWNATNGRRLRTLSDRTDPVSGAIFSTDGKYVIGGYSYGTITIWDALSGAKVRTVTDNTVGSMVISPDGRFIAYRENSRVKIRDFNSLREVKTFEEKDLYPRGVRFSPELSTIAILGDSGVIRIYGTHNWLEQQAIYAPETLYAVQFSPDGKNIAGGYIDGYVSVWDISTGEESISQKLPDSGLILDMDYAPNGSEIVFSYLKKSDGVFMDGLMVINAKTGQKLWASTNYNSHAIYSPNGRFIAFYGIDDQNHGYIGFIDAETKQEITE